MPFKRGLRKVGVMVKRKVGRKVRKNVKMQHKAAKKSKAYHIVGAATGASGATAYRERKKTKKAKAKSYLSGMRTGAVIGYHNAKRRKKTTKPRKPRRY